MNFKGDKNMRLYDKPSTRGFAASHFSFPAMAQSGGDFTFNFGPCDGGPTVLVENGQYEGCFGENPAGQSVSFLCSETGSTEYVFSFESAVAGSLSCGGNLSPFIVQGTVSGDVPSVCTVTSAIDPAHCDACNNSPESLGNNNCNDGIDNDCDGSFDQNEFNCAG
jgi:hypothetical protein